MCKCRSGKAKVDGSATQAGNMLSRFRDVGVLMRWRCKWDYVCCWNLKCNYEFGRVLCWVRERGEHQLHTYIMQVAVNGAGFVVYRAESNKLAAFDHQFIGDSV